MTANWSTTTCTQSGAVSRPPLAERACVDSRAQSIAGTPHLKTNRSESVFTSLPGTVWSRTDMQPRRPSIWLLEWSPCHILSTFYQLPAQMASHLASRRPLTNTRTTRSTGQHGTRLTQLWLSKQHLIGISSRVIRGALMSIWDFQSMSPSGSVLKTIF